MIAYLIVYFIGFASPYIIKFIIFPQFAKTETWAKIKLYMDKLAKEKEKE